MNNAALLSVILIVFAAIPAISQDVIPGRIIPDKPLNVSVEGDPLRIIVPMTAAEKELITRMSAQIGSIVRSAKAMNPPQGVEVRGWSVTDGVDYIPRPAKAPLPLDYVLSMFQLYRDCESCPVQVEGEARGTVDIHINTPEVLLSPHDTLFQGKKYRFMYTMLRVTGEVGGFPQYEDGSVSLARVPVGTPVTQEQYLTNLITRKKADFGVVKHKEAKTSTENLNDMNLEADIDDAVKAMAQIDPKAAAAMRDSMRATMQQVRKNLKESEGQEENEKAEGQTNYREYIAKLEAELAVLSKAERAAPAYVHDAFESCTTVPRVSGLTSGGEKCGRPVVLMNWGWYDTTFTRTDIQSIILRGRQGGDPTSYAENDPVIYRCRMDLNATLDWKRLEGMIRKR